jgi:hypothetical protein
MLYSNHECSIALWSLAVFPGVKRQVDDAEAKYCFLAPTCVIVRRPHLISPRPEADTEPCKIPNNALDLIATVQRSI